MPPTQASTEPSQEALEHASIGPSTQGLPMLTTEDNPYDPFTEFDEWYLWDTTQGYHTLPYLARVCAWSEELSEVDQESVYMEALDEILELNITSNYKIVWPK